MKAINCTRVLVLSFILVTSISSCKDEPDSPELSIHDYLAFEEAIIHSFDLIASEVNNSQGSIANYKDFRSASQIVLEEGFPYFEEEFNRQLGNSSNKSSFSEGSAADQETEIPAYLQLVVSEVNEQLDLSQTDEDFTEYLKIKFESEYASDSRTIEEKDRILTYLISYHAGMKIIKDYPELFENDRNNTSEANMSYMISPRSGWFSWKCLASVVGSAMTGALAGCVGLGGLGATVGAAVGLAPGAIVGGVGGCALGGRVGALGGAIYSASKC